MSDTLRVTVFKFVCAQCQAPNEYQQTHPSHVRPHLVSTRCARCQSLNWLGGLEGALMQEPAVDASPVPALKIGSET
jgi:hypothetical protein